MQRPKNEALSKEGSTVLVVKDKNIAKLKGLLHIQDAQDLAQDDKYAKMLRVSLQRPKFRFFLVKCPNGLNISKGEA